MFGETYSAVPRPEYVEISPGGKIPDRYDTVELKYDGQWGELHCGFGKNSNWWEIRTRSDKQGKGGRGLFPTQRCVIVGEWIFDTSWGQQNPWGKVEPRRIVPSPRDSEGHWTPGGFKPIGRNARSVENGYFAAFDVLYAHGKDLRRIPLNLRRALLQNLVHELQPAMPWVRATAVWERSSWRAVWNQKVVDGGWEGLVFKDSSKPYADAAWAKM